MEMYKILRMDKAKDHLQKFPNSGSIPRYSILKKQGYRVVIVENHLVFYKVNEEGKIVIIYAIVDGRMVVQMNKKI